MNEPERNIICLVWFVVALVGIVWMLWRRRY
jgi:hypothetical protein